MSIYYPRNAKTDVLLSKIRAEAYTSRTIIPDTISYFNSSKEETAREVQKDGALVGITVFDKPNRHVTIKNFMLLKRQRLIKKRVRLIR